MKSTLATLGLLIAGLLPAAVACGQQDYAGKDLAGKDFSGKVFDRANFSGAVLKDANFRQASLQGANFNGADLTHASFFDANLTGADLRGIVAVFLWERVVLNDANLEGLDLRNVRLFAAKLRGANLKHTRGWNDVTQCDFSNADLRGADLRGATWTGQVPRFTRASYDETTLWPRDFDPAAAGATRQARAPTAAPPPAPAPVATPAPPARPALPGLRPPPSQPPGPDAPTGRAPTPPLNPPQRSPQATGPSRPVAPAAPPSTAATAGGKPAGLFLMTRYWSYTRTLEKAVWYFAADGRVYENLETGLSPEDLAAHRGRQGTCRWDGNVLTVTWADGTTARSEIERDQRGPGFMWDMGLFSPVKPCDRPDSLVGVYEGGESLSHGGNSVAVAKTLTLRADRTFTLSGTASLKGTTAATQLSAGSQGAATGTWQLSDSSLTLAGQDGKSTRRIAFLYDDGKSVRLFLGGMMFTRR